MKVTGKAEGAYNYKEEKSNLEWAYIQDLPCPPNILIHTKLLERALKFCKQLLRNQYSEDNMNDQVVNELRPRDAHSCQYYSNRV